MLQPTTPLRRPVHVRAALEKLVKENLDAVWTVSKTDPKYHPLKQLRMSGDSLEYYHSDGRTIVVRQNLTRPIIETAPPTC